MWQNPIHSLPLLLDGWGVFRSWRMWETASVISIVTILLRLSSRSYLSVGGHISALLFSHPSLLTVDIKSLCMSEGIQKRIQPDLINEIEGYSGGSFSEKMVKWKNDVDTLTHDDIKHAVKEALPSGVFR